MITGFISLSHSLQLLLTALLSLWYSWNSIWTHEIYLQF